MFSQNNFLGKQLCEGVNFVYTVTSGHTTAGADVWASRPPDAPGSSLEPPEKGGDASENIRGGPLSTRVCRMHRKDKANGKKPRLAVRSPEFSRSRYERAQVLSRSQHAKCRPAARSSLLESQHPVTSPSYRECAVLAYQGSPEEHR